MLYELQCVVQQHVWILVCTLVGDISQQFATDRYSQTNYMFLRPNLYLSQRVEGFAVLAYLLTIFKTFGSLDYSQLQGTWLRRKNEPEESTFEPHILTKDPGTSLTGVQCRSALTLTDELAHCLTSVKGIQLHNCTKYMFQTIRYQESNCLIPKF